MIVLKALVALLIPSLVLTVIIGMSEIRRAVNRHEAQKAEEEFIRAWKEAQQQKADDQIFKTVEEASDDFE